MNNKPFISVIMPVYNGEKYISKAIDSFINQKYLKKELIIVGNKSVDKSNLIIRKYVSKYPGNIKWISVADKGISNAYNIGLKKSKGDYICYLGSDDILYINVFSKLMELINLNLDIDVFYFDSYIYFIKNNKFILHSCFSNLFRFQPDKNILLRYGSMIGLQNMVFSKKIIIKNFLDEKNKYSMDYEIVLRLITIYKNKIKFFPVKIPFSINLIHTNISRINRVEQHKETIKVANRYVENFYQRMLVMILNIKMKICELLVFLKLYD